MIWPKEHRPRFAKCDARACAANDKTLAQSRVRIQVTAFQLIRAFWKTLREAAQAARACGSRLPRNKGRSAGHLCTKENSEARIGSGRKLSYGALEERGARGAKRMSR